MTNTFERVHTIDEWYDGARFGAADYQGRAHFYRSLYLDFDQWDADEDRFELAPISEEVLRWMIEAAELHQRWAEAYRAGQVPDSDEDMRILPQDVPRYGELTRLIDAAVATAGPRFVVRGEFEYESSLARVRWRPLDSNAAKTSDSDRP